MNNQIKRLCVLLAATAFLGLGSAALYSVYKVSSWQGAVTIWYQNMNEAYAKCESDRKSIYCESIPSSRKEFNESVVARDGWRESAEWFGIACFAVPIFIGFLFFSFRWVKTGRLREES